MATFSQNDIQLLQIGQAATKTTGNVSTLNDGEIGIFTPAGTRLTEATAATATEFRIVKKTPNGIILDSGIIKKASIKGAVATVFVASANQVSNLGYDGTSGSIDVTNDNEYHVRINMREGRTSNHGGLYLKHGFYKSDLTATQAEIASNLGENLINAFSKEADQKVKVSILCDNAGAALGVGPATLSYAEGSSYLVASLTTHTVVSGDFIRIGTAVTDSVYEVVSVNGVNIKVKQRITNVSATAVAGEVIVAATAATANFGLKLEGVALPHRTGKLHADLQPVIFDVTVEGFGATQSLVSVAATGGNGTEKQVKELEFFCQGNEGDIMRMGEPNIFDARTEASGDYEFIDLMVEDTMTTSIVSGPIKKRYTLAIPETTPNYAIAGTADDITDVLEVLAFGTATGALAL
tara:strand:- start:2896 stop:4122 length:1227 start_codon:yes stop_codon:yes gene_type:complete